MPSSTLASRTQILIGLCIPLAVLIGFFLAEPRQIGTVTVLVLVLATLLFPLVLRWHHPLLILSWNAAITPAWLPGSPPLWMLLSFICFVLLLASRSIREQSVADQVGYVTVPLIVLLGVVLLTATMTGGVGIRTLGGENYGGRGYVFITGAVMGYFALTAHRVKPERVHLYVAGFFLSGLTALVPNLAYLSGQAMWWLFYIFPPLFAMEQARGDSALNAEMVRIYGFGPGSLALLSWLYARYGMRGLLVWQRPWRFGLLAVALLAALYSGYRSILILAVLVCMFQFALEGLYRTRLAWILAGLVALAIPMLWISPTSLPLVVQRTISFLPIEVSPVAKASARATTEWRVEMWREVLPLVPRYLLLGKGYTIDPNELHMSMESAHRGYGAYRGAATAGDYHNGPLSVIIPFGVWGVLGLGWFLVASARYLYLNYQHGDPRLKRANTLLFAYFLAKSVSFLLIVGTLYVDLPTFIGLVGFAICLNGPRGRDAVRSASEASVEGQTHVRPVFAPPAGSMPYRRG